MIIFGRSVSIWTLILFIVIAVALAVFTTVIVRRILRRRGLASSSKIGALEQKLSNARKYTNVEIIDINKLVRKHKRQRILLNIIPAFAVPTLALVIVWANLPASEALTWTFTSVQGNTVSSSNNPGGGVVNGLSESPANGNYFSPAYGTAVGATVTINGTGFTDPTDILDIHINMISSSNRSGLSVCAVDSGDDIWCWGGMNQSSYPKKISRGDIPLGETIQSLSVGNDSGGCVATDAGNIYCWDGSLNPVLLSRGQIPVNEGIQTLSLASKSSGCALSSAAAVYCWGSVVNGLNTTNSTSPIKIKTVSDPGNGGTTMPDVITKISGNGTQGCAIASDAMVYCWGQNNSGQLGDNTTVAKYRPVPVYGVDGLNFIDVSVGSVLSMSNGYACAVTNTHVTYCWGHNSNGQFGNGTTTGSAVPVPAFTGMLVSRIISADASYYDYINTCAIDLGGSLYCVGGHNTGSPDTTPVKVTSTSGGGIMPDQVSDAVTGVRRWGCALASDYKVYCWGGTGNTNYVDNPLGVGGSGVQGVGLPVQTQFYAELPVVRFDGANGPECRQLKLVSSTKFTCAITGSALSEGLHDVIVSYDNSVQNLPSSYMYKTTPDPAQNFTGVGKNGTVSLSWDAAPLNKPYFSSFSYYVDYKRSDATNWIRYGNYNAGPSNVVTGSYLSTQNHFDVTKLENGVSYDFRILTQASGASGSSYAYTSATPAESNYVPSQPTIQSVTVSGNYANITWSAPVSDGGSPITNYTYEIKGSTVSDWGHYAGTDRYFLGTGTSTSIFLSANSPTSTTYNLRLYALNANGASVPYEVEFIKPASSTPQSPSAPYNIHVNNVNTDRTMLSWSAPSDNGSPITSYEVRYSTSPVFSDWVDNTTNTCISSTPAPPTTSCVTPSLTLGVYYYFQVRALNANGTSDWSIIHATIVGAPDRPVITSVSASDGEANVVWTVPSNNGASISQFTLQYSTVPDFSAYYVDIPITDAAFIHTPPGGNTPPYTINGLTNGTIYYFRVLATNSRGDSPWSDPASGIPYAPPIITAVNPSTGLTTGGEITVVTGLNFNGVTTVSIGGNNCLTFVIIDVNTINCLTPSGTVGAKDVYVANLGGSDTKVGGFTYVETYLTLSLDITTLNIDVTPNAVGVFAYNAHYATVRTNAHGYDLTLETGAGNRNLTRVGSNETIGPVSGLFTGSKSMLGTNQWGFTLTASPLATSSIWSAVPNLGAPVTIKSTNAPNETLIGDQTTVYYGTKVDMSIPAGTYYTSVVYTATAKL